MISCKSTDSITPPVGEVVFYEDTNEYFKWTGTEMAPLTPAPGLNLYDLNKQLVAQMDEMTDELIEEKLTEIQEWIRNTENDFYMFLCNEQKYYTVFGVHDDAPGNFSETMRVCVTNIGKVKAIDRTEDEFAYEFWIEDKEGPHAFYFFPYDQGVVVCHL